MSRSSKFIDDTTISKHESNRILNAEDVKMTPTGELRFVLAHAIYDPEGRYAGCLVVQSGGKFSTMSQVISDDGGERVPVGFKSTEEYREFCDSFIRAYNALNGGDNIGEEGSQDTSDGGSSEASNDS